jgi:peptide/nickel transport system ATP-binding protein
VAYLFVTHDLAVVRHISHRIVVMRAGRIVESGDTAALTEHPQDPYTRRLLLAAPVPDPARQAERRAEFHRIDVPV